MEKKKTKTLQVPKREKQTNKNQHSVAEKAFVLNTNMSGLLWDVQQHAPCTTLSRVLASPTEAVF